MNDEPYILERLPATHTESSTATTTPGKSHGEYGPRLEITDMCGFSASTRTGSWRWCETCQAWQKGVGILAALCCPKCRKNW